MIASIAFSAFILGIDPYAKLINASYNQDLANLIAGETQKLMNSPYYQELFATRLKNPRSRAAELVTMEGGRRYATSVGGTLTGRGGKFTIIDDALKPLEAASDVQRKNVNKWYDSTIPTRSDDKQNGAIIVIMQRLHEDDLVGHLMQQGHWELLSIPLIAEKDEEWEIRDFRGTRIVRRMEGELLHPARDGWDEINQMMVEMPAADFAAQAQQRPTPAGGGVVKIEWLRDYDPAKLPEFVSKFQSWDCASKITEISDYSVCTTWGITADGDAYLLDVYRERLEYGDLKAKVRELALLHRVETVLIEDAASGIQLIQELREEYFATIEPRKPLGTKMMRMAAQTTRMRGGKVWIPPVAHWRPGLLRELEAFPNGTYDDQVDSISQALAWVHSGSGPVRWNKMMEDRANGTGAWAPNSDQQQLGTEPVGDVEGQAGGLPEQPKYAVILDHPTPNIEFHLSTGRVAKRAADGFYHVTLEEWGAVRSTRGVTVIRHPDFR